MLALLSRVEVLEQAAVESTKSPASVAIRSTFDAFMCLPPSTRWFDRPAITIRLGSRPFALARPFRKEPTTRRGAGGGHGPPKPNSQRSSPPDTRHRATCRSAPPPAGRLPIEMHVPRE